MTKTKKAFSKRLKVTKKGRVMSRKPGQNHFRAKKSGAWETKKRQIRQFRINKKELGRYMPKN